MSLLLAVETAVDICSVALFNDTSLIDFRESIEGKSHASLLTVFIDDILQNNKIAVSQLAAVSVSMGPGSYTGLRIGVSAAKGLCYGAGIPLLAINTLQIITQSFLKNHENLLSPGSILCPMIDARRQEVYTATFDKNGNKISKTQALIIDKQSFEKELARNSVYFFGNGSDKCQVLIDHPNAVFINGIHPSAAAMGEMSYLLYNAKKFEDVAYFEPFYLKDFVATTPKNKVL